MKISHWIYIASTLLVVGILSFILNRFGILTLLDGLFVINSYVYLIPMGGFMIYLVIVLSGQWFIKVLMSLFVIIAFFVFFIVVIFETPTKVMHHEVGIIVESRSFFFSGTDRFYQRNDLFYSEVFTCETGEEAYCNYIITEESLIITYGYYGGQEHTKIVFLKED
jgi:ABC-type antimicrobial peptide transport system permease subunit